MDKTTKVFMWIGIGLISAIILKKIFKKEDEPFIISTNDPNIQKSTKN